MNSKPLALIFSTVWPEPDSSAAGVRQIHWLGWLQAAGYEVVLSSPSKFKVGLDLGVELLPLPLNQSWVKEELKRRKPELIIFDRFILEEQFGHFVYEACPNAVVLLETQDLHLVRRARDPMREKFLSTAELPPNFYQTETALRETASLMRVDHSVVVSSFEAKLLQDEFSMGSDRVTWIPFGYTDPVIEKSHARPFSEREEFVWIGNFRHAPNIDGLRWFRQGIWPLIRKQMPKAQIKVYGAYPSEEVMNWNKPETGFQVLGPAKDLDQAFQSARVNLAPLRFGAGVKGKILEGFRYGLPCVTTRVGVEGILPQDLGSDWFPGREANDEVQFAADCVALYENEKEWSRLRERARALMLNTYANQPKIQAIELLKHLSVDREAGSLPRWQSRVLRHELLNSHKYFSKWIETKEKQSKQAIIPDDQK